MAEFGGTLDESFVEMLREEGLTSKVDENSDGDGMTLAADFRGRAQSGLGIPIPKLGFAMP